MEETRFIQRVGYYSTAQANPEDCKICHNAKWATILIDGICLDCLNIAGAKSTKRLLRAAKDVFYWYYIFGEDNDTAKEHLAELGNAIKNYESHEKENATNI